MHAVKTISANRGVVHWTVLLGNTATAYAISVALVNGHGYNVPISSRPLIEGHISNTVMEVLNLTAAYESNVRSAHPTIHP
jgi:hypothetical protein